MSDKQLSQWFNCKTDPPRYRGYYDFKMIGNDHTARRMFFDPFYGLWFRWDGDVIEMSSKSEHLGHCEWRGVFEYPGEGFTCEDMD